MSTATDRRPRLSRTATALLVLALGASPVWAVKRRSFVTSVAGTGNLSTWPGASGATALDKADSVCRARAAAANTPLPNSSTYRAWLSTSTTDAYCHVQGLTGKKATGCGGGALPGGGPWFLSNGATNFSGSLDELTGEGRIFRPASRDENFAELPAAEGTRVYWTGSDATGVATATHCAGWTSDTPGVNTGSAGDSRGTVGLWSRQNEYACAGTHRLLCVEPLAGDVSTLHWSPAALVFLTSKRFQGDLSAAPEAQGEEGLDAADRICQVLAGNAHLPSPESFVAWLSGTAPPVDAADRVLVNGPFKRVDAYTVAGDFADLGDGTLDTSLHQFETGDYLMADCTDFSRCRVWTGSDGGGATSLATCNDWSDSIGGFFGTNGSAAHSLSGPLWTNLGMTSCNISFHLYCISNRITLFWDSFELTGDVSRWSSVQN